MAHEIKIYGEITPFQDSNADEYGYYNLKSLERDLSEANGKDVRVRINSFGGDVDEGFAIYSSLRRYAKENNAKIITLAEGRCASIATVIFLAGDERVLTKHTEPFVHDAWMYTQGNAKQLRLSADELEKASKRIAEHYAEHTDLTVDEALVLMEDETSITPEECVKLRFATKIEELARPVALQKIINKQTNINKMANTENVGTFEEFFSKLSALLNSSKKEPKKIQNKIVFDANQSEVDFYELGEDEVIEVGAKATIDGKPADGDVLMADGNTFVFSNGELIEIKEAEEDVNDEDSRIAELEAELASLKASKESELNAVQEENKTLQNKVTELEAVVNKIKALETEFKNEKKTPPRKEATKTTTSDLVAQFKQNKFKSK